MSKRTKFNLIVISVVLLAILIGVSSAHSGVTSAPEEVTPYQFAQFPVSMQLTNGQVFKTVHEGCELYIAVIGKASQSPSVSITTGRGCK